MSTACWWVSGVIGTLFGLLMGLLAGPGKLFKVHPMFKMLEPQFQHVIGNFFGVPHTPIQVLIGLAELVAGWGLLVGLWGQQLMGAALRELVDALLICDGVGLLTVMIMAFIFHFMIEGFGFAAPYIVFNGLLGIFIYCRVEMTGVGAYSVLINSFACVCIVVLVLSLLARVTLGAGLDGLRTKMQAVKAEMGAKGREMEYETL
eukprot:gnl/MRDRNA2_/MRDRNA2_49137_c0_seq1.p1 gnl/MRDRNA2_/MRDRNA2_49137_c0~~gnl/MRDRNA2_/MRDRNA2_49137_c0_seq1.p1  ORF type:complete len:204 (-),score=39.35 gnl/MRDRNA2_/MRDRNA2_49137_c0_seq1:142-753(-)